MHNLSSRRPLSIRAQMILLVLAVTLTMAAGMSWLILAESRDMSAAAHARVKHLADDSAARLGGILRDYTALLKHLATRPGVKALDPGRCDPLLAEYLQLFPEFNALVVRDARANPVCSARVRPLPATQVHTAPWFQRGMGPDRFAASDAELGYFTGRWVAVLTHHIDGASGDVTGGTASGLLALPLDLLQLNARMLSSVASGAMVTVYDRKGNTLLRSVAPEKWIGQRSPAANISTVKAQEDSFDLRQSVDGVPRLYAYVSMPSTGWRVVAGMPEEEVFASQRERLKRGVALGLSALLLWLWLAYRISAAIVRPITDLAQTTARVATGDIAARARPEGPPEIKAVATQFNDMLDIQRRANASLRRLSEAVEQSPVSIVITDAAGNIEYVNPKFTRVTGYTAEEVLGQNPRILKSGETGDDTYAQLWATIAAGGEWAGELHNRKKNGELFWEHARILPIRDAAGRIVNFLEVKEDITDRKHAEELAREAHEQLRLLTMRLNSMHEAESGLLSRELHDEFGQMLTTLKMDLAWLASRLDPGSIELKKKVASSLALVDQSVQSVRSIAARLRPRILDELGLMPAIEGLVQDFRERSGLDVALVSNTRAGALTPEQKTAVFRIVQEALINIARHADATRVDVSMYAQSGWLTLEIRDNGKGMRTDGKAGYESIGLLGMRERALAAAGELTLRSVAGRGTVVTLRLPLAEEDA